MSVIPRTSSLFSKLTHSSAHKKSHNKVTIKFLYWDDAVFRFNKIDADIVAASELGEGLVLLVSILPLPPSNMSCKENIYQILEDIIYYCENNISRAYLLVANSALLLNKLCINWLGSWKTPFHEL